MSRLLLPILVLFLGSFTFVEPAEEPPEPNPIFEEIESQLQRIQAVALQVEEEGAKVEHLVQRLMSHGVTEDSAYVWARYFHYYGRKAGVDPILLASIAYQESRFNPRAYNPNDPSWGLMQVVPRFWRYGFVSECGAEATKETLYEPRVSICYGAHIAAYFGATYITLPRNVTAYNNGSGRPNGYYELVAAAYELLQ